MKFPIVPKEYLCDFIRGCWDGDGTVSFTRSDKRSVTYTKVAYLTSGSKAFCDQMKEKLFELGVESKVIEHNCPERMIEGRKLKPSNNWRVLISNSKDVYNFVKLIYSDNKLVMQRKMTIAQSIINHRENIFCKTCKKQLIYTNGKLEFCNECLKQRTREQQRFYYAQRVRAAGKIYYLDDNAPSNISKGWLKLRK